MRKVKNIVFIALSVAVFAFFSSCDDEEDGPMVIEITQAQLDAATNPLQLDLTGGGFAHNGTNVGGDGTYRDIFGSVANLPAEIAPGTIITKNTWMAEDGNKTDKLQVSFAMVKREAGYDTDNKDWEYIMIAFDENNDYTQHPFGMLENANRGKLEGCIDCHAKGGGGDFLFVND